MEDNSSRAGELVSFDVPLSISAVRRRIISFAGHQSYEVEDICSECEVVLGESPSVEDTWSWLSWGCLYPIHLSPRGQSTRVEVGVRGKFIRAARVTSGSHQRITEKLKVEFSVNNKQRDQ